MSSLILILSTSLLALLIVNVVASHLRHRRRLLNKPPLPPGPRPWPIIGNLPHLGPKPHQTLAALARSYGPLLHLRLGSVHVLVAASSSVASLFLKTHDSLFSSRPPNSGAKHIAYNYNDLVFAPYGPRWRSLRRVCAVHLFSNKALDDFRHVRRSELALLASKLASLAAGEAVNLAQALNVCTTNALARALIGRTVFEGEGEAGEFKGMVVELMVLAGVFNIGDFVPALDALDLQGVAGKMKRLHRRFDHFLNGIIDDHRRGGAAASASGAANSDLLTVLMGLQEDDDKEGVGKLSDTEIKALLLDLFTAGTDTSSSTVEWALAELIRHPDILTKVQQELDSVVGPDRLVSESDLANLPYFQAVIKETFRLHPSTPLSLPRMAAEDCEIKGYFIPKNSTLLVNVWAIARDPEVWPEPLEFKPSRFLPGSPQANVDIRGNDFEVIPFGAGRRICAGMSLGLRMVQFMAATLIHAFNWALPDGQLAEKLDMEEAYGLTLQRAVPLTVHPVPRLAPHVYTMASM